MSYAIAQRICTHASPVAKGVNRCDLGLFGGRPSVGTCEICKDRLPPPADGLLTEESEARVEAHKAVCRGCAARTGWAPLPGTLVDVFVLCGDCPCPRRRVNLLTGACPRKLWSNYKNG